MTYNFELPPLEYPAETDVPGRAAFRRRPAGTLQSGDLVWLNGEAWRIKDRRQLRNSILINFVLAPCAGGRPVFETFAPREWLPAVVFDTTEDTKPMPPVVG